MFRGRRGRCFSLGAGEIRREIRPPVDKCQADKHRPRNPARGDNEQRVLRLKRWRDRSTSPRSASVNQINNHGDYKSGGTRHDEASVRISGVVTDRRPGAKKKR